MPNGSVYRPDLKEKGYDYDAIGTDLIGALSVEDGKIVLPSGMRYSLLAMPTTKTMSVAVAKKIQELLEAGATVLAVKPEQSPSLTESLGNHQELATIAENVWGKDNETTLDRKVGAGRILSGYSVEQALDRIGLRPDFEVLSDNRRMNFIHRTIDGADVYFVSNQQNNAGIIRCAFRVTGRQPELWDSQRGKIAPAMLWQEENGRTEVTLTLEPEESVFVVFNDAIGKNPDNYVAIERRSGSAIQPLQNQPDKLEILKAEYGVFSLTQSKMVDVTDKLNTLIKENRLTVTAGNQLAGDPAANIVKKLLVQYIYDGKNYSINVNEGQRLELPPSELPSGKELKIQLAVYGNLPEQLAKLPELKTIDITKRLAAKVIDGILQTRITNELAGGDPVVNVPKQLRVQYSLNGVKMVMVKGENEMLEIPNKPWKPSPWPAEILRDKKGEKLLTWDDGTYHLIKANGGESVVTIEHAPKPIKLDGPWSVQFESMVQSPKPTVLNVLRSLPELENPEQRAFSGTVIYQKKFNVTKEMLKAPNQIMLDLGQVEVMARVIINGKDLGVLWKNPYRVDITKALKKGKNRIEIQVTNLWVNRIIADQAYPDDCTWQGPALAEWPEWFIKDQERPSKNRLTFYTWKHWNKDDPLLPSGLIGPVYIRVGQLQQIERN